MRFEGHLKTWNDERGFGFIEPVQGGQDVFVHIKDLPAGSGRPSVGLPLSFEVTLGPKGKKRAVRVQFARQPHARQTAASEPSAPWTLARKLVWPVFAAVGGWAAWRWGFNPLVPLAYLLLSTLTFLSYAVDKSAARSGGWRVSETTLHALALVGGWPGALLAQQRYRHKTRKPAFVPVFWATVVINLAALAAGRWMWRALPGP